MIAGKGTFPQKDAQGLPMTDQPPIYFDVSVLCVEDEPLTLEYLTTLLRPHVREIFSAKDGQEGFFEFARSRPDIVLTDMEMPRMDGLEMGQAIRSLSSASQIILITGLDDPAVLKRGIQLKADGFLSKPISFQDLLGSLERCTEAILVQREVLAQRRLRELILNSLPFPLALLNTVSFETLFANSEAQRQGIAPHEPAVGPFFPEPVRREIQESMALAEKLERMTTPTQIHVAEQTWEVCVTPVAPETSLYVAVDITAREQLESLKADVERLTRHDLKGPLGGIIGLTDMLLHQSGAAQNTLDWVDTLGMIRDSGHAMLHQINLSLDLFNMEQGTYILSPMPIDIPALIRETLPQIEQHIRMRQLQVDIRIDGRPMTGDERFFVLGEKLLCLSMLSNLLKNAAEASSQGGTITFNLHALANDAQISLHNSLPVPAAIRNRFFEKYVTAGKRHGTGLGAYSAALIAKTLGGTISMDSSEEQGTTITVVLPRPPVQPS
ncbi:hybrid sensor histidine kinase/response regulator [Desulfonatronum thioautotrophicum]|uniref:hybrid sensor histidine kinase/response regulator n=1 Tax=Desulfonatronum thioautotrophicum TaxID=617001 RepID=UPI00069B7B32|nr:response regulator [Desulfonatronum thioautotrophicum]